MRAYTLRDLPAVRQAEKGGNKPPKKHPQPRVSDFGRGIGFMGPTKDGNPGGLTRDHVSSPPMGSVG